MFEELESLLAQMPKEFRVNYTLAKKDAVSEESAPTYCLTLYPIKEFIEDTAQAAIDAAVEFVKAAVAQFEADEKSRADEEAAKQAELDAADAAAKEAAVNPPPVDNAHVAEGAAQFDDAGNTAPAAPAVDAPDDDAPHIETPDEQAAA